MAAALFTFMYAQWEDKEIYDIARNPGNYVIAISDLITNQFHVLGYVTKRTQIGEIYFEKYEALKPPAKEGDKGIVEQRNNAQIIAFYFVRLFQMMSSLLLVVKDFNWRDIGAPEALTANEAAVAAGRLALQQGVALPRFQPALPLGTPFRGGARQQGGGVVDENLVLGPYEFLRYYLRTLSPEEKREFLALKSTTNDVFKVTDAENLYFELANTNYKGKSQVDRDFIPQQIFHIKITRGGGKTPSIVSVVSKITDLVPTIIRDIKTPAGEGDDPIKQLGRYFGAVTVSFLKGGQRAATADTVKFERVDNPAELKSSYKNGARYKIVEGLGVDALSSFMNSEKDVMKMLESIVLIAARKLEGDITLKLAKSYEKAAETTTSVRKVDGVPMPSKLSNPALDETYQLLKDRKHQPHCIARAIQLIDIKSLEKYLPTGAKTSICKFSVGDKVNPTGLDTYTPIKSLAALYGRVNPTNFKEASKILSAFVLPTSSDQALISVSDLENAGQKEEAKSLSLALQSLHQAFRLTGDPKVDSISQLQAARPSECKGSDTLDITSQAVGLKLQSTAQQMLAFHVNMCIEISKFLKAVFNIQRLPNGEMRVLGPRTEILFAGFPALDQLVAQARGLLVDYYSGCEKMYQSGVAAWQKDQPTPFRPPPAGVPGAAPGGAPLPSAPP